MGNATGSVEQVVGQVVTIPSDTLAAQLSFVWSGTSTDGEKWRFFEGVDRKPGL